MTKIHWLTIEIGYQSTVPDTCKPDQKPHLQNVLETLLTAASLSDWGAGADLEIGKQSDDSWTRDFMQDQINQSLSDRHHHSSRPGLPPQLTLLEEDLCWLTPGPKLLDARSIRVKWTGSPGTRCKLRGDTWINSRTYALFLSDGEPWLQHHLPDDTFMFAKLSWICQPVRSANLRASAVATKPGKERTKASTSARRRRPPVTAPRDEAAKRKKK